MANQPKQLPCLTIRPVDVSQGAHLSFSDSSNFFPVLSPKSWLPQPPNSLSPSSFMSLLPTLHTEIFQNHKSGHWVLPPLKSFSDSGCCLSPHPQPPTQVRIKSKLFILAHHPWWPGPGHFYGLVSHQSPSSWPSMHQWSGTGVVPWAPGSLLPWTPYLLLPLLIPCCISPLPSLIIL